MEKHILLFIIIVLVLGIVYLYGLLLDRETPEINNENVINNIRKDNKSMTEDSNTVFSSPDIIKPTFQFSTEQDNSNIKENNDINISNVEVYDDLLIDDKKYYFDRELYINFDYELPINEYFYFSILIDAIEESKHKITFNKNITLRMGNGNLSDNPLSFVISSNKGDKTDLVISRARILVNNMENEIVYNNIIPLDILVQHEDTTINNIKNTIKNNINKMNNNNKLNINNNNINNNNINGNRNNNKSKIVKGINGPLVISANDITEPFDGNYNVFIGV
tara:strand:+ start:1665 stop:2501 length:837 start_codon:yes stop_codon:yes gene_type:complete